MPNEPTTFIRFYVAGAEAGAAYRAALGAKVAALLTEAATKPMALRLQLEREALPSAQIAVNQDAPMGYELVESIYGWTVRFASGLQDFAIVCRATGTRQNPSSLAEGIAAAKFVVAAAGRPAYCTIRASYGTGEYGHVLSPEDRATWDEVVANAPGF
jgi:hypothetical protein